MNEEGKVLLVKHVFRAGSGWGIPGGFLQYGEQPVEGLRRELREELGLELANARIFEARSFKKPRQVEILFLCHAKEAALSQSLEVDRAVWFPPNSLPAGLPHDQRLLVERALSDGAK